VCILEPMTPEEIEALRGKSLDEIREAVKGGRG
jgi:hypothetical protein